MSIPMRRFQLHRHMDVSGVSGTGVVAEGVEFGKALDIVWPDGVHTTLPAGWVRLVWRTEVSSTGLYASVAEVETVHGHGGATVLVWLDERPLVVDSLSRPWSEALASHDQVTGLRSLDRPDVDG
jgi:hypothetical protein